MDYNIDDLSFILTITIQEWVGIKYNIEIVEQSISPNPYKHRRCVFKISNGEGLYLDLSLSNVGGSKVFVLNVISRGNYTLQNYIIQNLSTFNNLIKKNLGEDYWVFKYDSITSKNV